MFPKTTFVDKETYPLVNSDNYNTPLHSKMTARGWPLANLDGRWEDGKPQTETYDCWLGQKAPYSPNFESWLRRIGDRRSWIMSFSTIGIKAPEKPDSVIEFSEFSMHSTEIPENGYRVKCPMFASPILKYMYTYKNILGRLGDKLAELTKSAMERLGPGKRPDGTDWPLNDVVTGVGDLFWEFPDGYEPPQGWTYVDDQLPEWYAIEEQNQARERQNERLADGNGDGDEMDLME